MSLYQKTVFTKTCKICGVPISCNSDYCSIHRNKDVQEKHKEFDKNNKINKGKSYKEYLADVKKPLREGKLPSFF